MRKKLFLIILVSLLFVFGCRTNNEWEIDAGINIFNEIENIKLDFYPGSSADDGVVVVENGAFGLVIYQSGETVEFNDSVEFKTHKNKVFNRNEKALGPVAGVYIGKEIFGITMLNDDVTKSIDEEIPVMAILLDGFSSAQLKAASDIYQLDFFDKYYFQDVLSVYKPVTNAGFAAMITGHTPDVNGVHNRSYRDLKADSIFGYALLKGREAILLEGDIKILNTEVEPILHTDQNKDGDTDDEMFSTALKEVEIPYGLLFIHFHGIDDRGHEYGPMASETLNYIKTVDSWLVQLENVWSGNIVATADHGMHVLGEAGDHGICRYEDMIVPYFKKENRNE